MKFTCPVCDYSELDQDPKLQNYNICEQCGAEFGASDRILTHEELRTAWINAGRPFWYSTGNYS